MSTSKVILFYVFTPLVDPEAIRLWQYRECASLNLLGRIIISSHGINGTVGGDMEAVKKYVRRFRSYSAFKKADIKWSDGTGADFPRLSVKVRDEIVTFGVPDEVKVDVHGVIGTGIYLKPQQLHDLLDKKGDEVVFFDGRNEFEARIGKFKNAIIPPVRTTKEFVPLLDSGVYDHLKNKPVVTYCTGGIRCEILTSLMKNRGFTEVYQLAGGIVRYAEHFGNKGFWKGSLFVFDNRMHTYYSPTPEFISDCVVCGVATDNMANYPDPNGRQLVVICKECLANQKEIVKT